MEFSFIIVVIAWIVIGAVAKKKQRENKEAAERERARRLAAQEANGEQPILSKPQPFDPYSPQPTAKPAPAPRPINAQSTPQTRVRTQTQTTLTQMRETPIHVVRASSEGGHVHEETSMTGIKADCAPDAATTLPPAASSPAAQPAFVWNANMARNGLVLAEILGKPVALRD